MAYTFAMALIDSVLGFFLIDKFYWAVSLIFILGTLFFAFKSKSYDKLSSLIAAFSVIIPLFVFFRLGSDRNVVLATYLFYVLINAAGLTASAYGYLKDKLLIILSWLLNAFAFGILVSSFRDLKWGIGTGLIIFFAGSKDIFFNKKETDSGGLNDD